MTSLSVSGLTVSYGANQAVHGVDLSVASGACLAVLGTNGAGKSSLLNAVAGLVRRTTGTVTLGDRDVSRLSAHRRARAGIALVPEEHHLFPTMTVSDTLLLAARYGRPGIWTPESVIDLFPRLHTRRTALNGTLSGGERQMVALSRALLLNPGVLLLDEPSAGLAPKLFHEVLDAVKQVTATGLTVLLAEQNVVGARRIADDFVVLRDGVVYGLERSGATGADQELTELLWGA
jgi:branched-chain amino acid transport system ATP-binding protein